MSPPTLIEVPDLDLIVAVETAFPEAVRRLLAAMPPAEIGCQIHPDPGYHRPRPLRLVFHHIQPLGMGGADRPSNRVLTCDTGHYNMHRLQADLIRNGVMRYRRGTTRERVLADRGYTEWTEAGRPGRPVYEAWTPR